ncbi:glycosyltransferase [Aeromonas dhakensis]|uniref:glycosyltransferase n=1 Tax=Aeromonas TaxID=642 RepID=UPI001C5BA246|nr:glycosyltransferase [Aeromonas hydrophila]MBW3833736.1 glycosyltransferase [Aeromonas hydrophila]MBW5265777.1 glycosyltransferase [Aeromonas hydrophila]MBW5279130.1 glycosyltransferase [Aeromonas hydrophila]
MTLATKFFSGSKIEHSRNLISNPKVSVILPTYCRARSGLLRRSIDSVLNQDFLSFELIVIDDGSTDGTEDILREYVGLDNRVIYVRHDDNSGLPALRVNEGLMMSRGEYCAYQFDDDCWLSDTLSVLVDSLERNKNYDIAYGKAKVKYNGGDYVLGDNFDYSKLINGNYIANNSILHRRTTFEKFGGYDMHLVMRRLCDWDLWLRWGKNSRFLFVDHIVSLVDAGMDGSLGKTVYYDELVARAHMSCMRDHQLTPDLIAEYNIDSLAHLQHLGKERLDEVWRHLIAPFQSRHRDLWPIVKREQECPKHVLVIKKSYDTTVDITINNFKELLSDDYMFTFIPQDLVDDRAIKSSDIVIMHRTMDNMACQILYKAHNFNKCVVFLMDDDLLNFHELSDGFSYLSPGAECRIALENIIINSDLVITYSRLMKESIESYNVRNVMLKTNINDAWLCKVRNKVSANYSRLIDSGIDIKRPLKIAFSGGGARKEEFLTLWPALVEISKEFKDQVEFYFWGFLPENIGMLESAYHCEPFTYSYGEYLSRLIQENFDIMLAPLFTDKRAKQAKCPIKFLEITAAGAIGIYSDVEPYDVVIDGQMGFKCENNPHSWLTAIQSAINLSLDERHKMLSSSLDRITYEYTAEKQKRQLSSTLDSALLHSALRAYRGPNRPKIAYICHSPYLGGAENHLLRHSLIAQSFHFDPILVFPFSAKNMQCEMQSRAQSAGIEIDYLPLIVETEINNDRLIDTSSVDYIYKWLKKNRVSLVHSVTLMKEVGEAAKLANIAHVSSLYATSSIVESNSKVCDMVHSDSLLYANQWSQLLNVPSKCILSYVPEDYFLIGESSQIKNDGKLNIGIFGTLQPRKGQRQAIEALGILCREHGIRMNLGIYGYDHFFPDYVEECKKIAREYGIEDSVIFHGFVENTANVISSIDIVLCASDWESLPQVILEGMAARRLVVSPLVGGVGEVLSERNGIVIQDNSAHSICDGLIRASRLSIDEINNRLNISSRVVDNECNKFSVASSLFRLYLSAHQLIVTNNDWQGQLLPRDSILGNVSLIDKMKAFHTELEHCTDLLKTI